MARSEKPPKPLVLTTDEGFEPVGSIKSDREQGRRKRGRARKTPEVAEEVSEPEVTSEGPADTRAERKEALARAVERLAAEEKRNAGLAERAGVEVDRTLMQQAEAAYLSAYKDQIKKKSLVSRLFKGKEVKELDSRVDQLKQDYDLRRLEYARRLEGSARERLINKHYTEPVSAAISESAKDLQIAKIQELHPEFYVEDAILDKNRRILERYNRLVRFNEIVKPAAEKRIEARYEALNEKGKSGFLKALGYVAKQNRKLENIAIGKRKLGKTGAKVVRIAVTTAVLTGTAAAAGAVGTAGVLGLLGVGTLRFGKAFALSFIGGAAGTVVGEIYESEARKDQTWAQDELKSAGRSGDTTLLYQELAAYDRKRERLGNRADERALQKEKQIIQIVVAAGLGTISSFSAQILEQIIDDNTLSDVPTEATRPDSTPVRASSGNVPPVEAAGTAPVEASVASSPAAVATASPETSSVSAAPTETPATASAANIEAPKAAEMVQAEIDAGEGSDKLFADLKQELRAKYPEGQPMPPAVQKILETHPHVLSKAFGFVSGENASALMYEGDTLAVNEKGQLIFEREGKTFVLLDEHLKPAPLPSSVLTMQQIEASLVAEQLPTEGGPTAGELLENSSLDSDSAEATSSVETDDVSADDVSAAGDTTVPSESTPASPTPAEAATGPSTGISDVQTLDQWNASRSGAEQVSETFTNHHGVAVNPGVATMYQWQIPGYDQPAKFVYGGSTVDATRQALEYVTGHPKTTVMFERVFKDPVTGIESTRVDAWTSNGRGTEKLIQGVLHPDGRLVTPPDPRSQFISKIAP
jgi:hypothetical protein